MLLLVPGHALLATVRPRAALRALSRAGARLEGLLARLGGRAALHADRDPAWLDLHHALAAADPDGALRRAMVGGRVISGGGDHVVTFVAAHEVEATARALARIGPSEFRERYRVGRARSRLPGCDACAAGAWRWLERLRGVYQRAAAELRVVLFVGVVTPAPAPLGTHARRRVPEAAKTVG